MNWKKGLAVALSIAAVLIVGLALLATIPVVQMWLSLLFLSVLCLGVVVFGLGSHKTWWKSGGGRNLALVGVAAFLGAWGVSAFTVMSQSYFRSHGLGVVADAIGPLTLVVTLIGGVGMLYRAMGNRGNSAWIVGMFILALLVSGTNAATLWAYGERADRVHPLTGTSAWKVCQLTYTSGSASKSYSYPVWDEQQRCPLQDGKPADAAPSQITEWERAGLAPGMDEAQILSRTLCRIHKDAVVARAVTAGDEESATKALLAAEQDNVCSIKGDASAFLDEQGGWAGLLTVRFLVGGLVLLTLLVTLVQWVSSLGKGDGTPPPTGSH